MIPTTLVAILAVASSALAATDFASVDISRTPGNGAAALAAAAAKCPNTLSAQELDSIRRLAEGAENRLFDPTGLSGAKKAAILCQRDRNKVLKNFCEKVKGEVSGDSELATANTAQSNKNARDVDNRCANVDASLFVVDGAAAPAAPAAAADKPAKADKPKADKPKADKPAAGANLGARKAEFAKIDISKTNGNGDAALAAAKSVCSDNLSAKELKDLGSVAEAAENTVFAVEGLSGAKKAAVQCQRDRNKVLKNFCQLLSAQKDNKADQLALNTKQVAKNTGDVTNRCGNVDTSLFV
ncbi:hypothetical protein BC831DRAFT_470184 [Entophlyctis helioformis]|nr:hypothetical protein BC831DRAFT_470184 [Entophlyctis helioformis]